MTDIQQWLGQLGLQKYGALFAAHEITFEVLPDLTESDIDRLALPTGPRRRLMLAIQALRAIRDRPSAHHRDSPAASPALTRDAERRQLTVMFCDLVGATGRAEALDPEEHRELMRACYSAAGEVVARFDGHVAQYPGRWAGGVLRLARRTRG